MLCGDCCGQHTAHSLRQLGQLLFHVPVLVHSNDGLSRQILSLRVESLRNELNLLQQGRFILIGKFNLNFDLTRVGLGASCRPCLHLHGAEEGAGDLGGEL